jgi:hypothetical protein
LLSRPEVDPTRLGVTGSSQGGGLTIATAAIRPEIRAAAAGAPYLCGFMDAIALTHTYPYEEINDFLRAHLESRRTLYALLSTIRDKTLMLPGSTTTHENGRYATVIFKATLLCASRTGSRVCGVRNFQGSSKKVSGC